MWFAVIFIFRAFENNAPKWFMSFWFAENEGELPDNNFVFEAGNGEGIGGSIRNHLPRSLSVGDSFTIIPVNEPFQIGISITDDYVHIADFYYENGHNSPLVTVEPLGFSEKSHAEYWAL